MTDITHCVACGQKFSGSDGGYDNHHCPEAFENRRVAIDRREQEYQLHGFTEAQRLNYGFYLMSLNGGF